MNGYIKRGLLTVLVTGGFLALGAGVAYADDTTDGSGGTASGSQALLGINLPITVGGNGISVLGDSSSSGSSNTGSTGGSSPSVSTGGTNSLLGGSQGVVDANVPVTIGGNAISVLGDSSSEGSSFAGESGSGEAGSASTSGKDGIAGGTQVVGDVSAPITVNGNAISVAGDSFSGQSGTVSSSDSEASGSSGNTSGDDSVAGGSQVLADAGVPVVVGGNAISVIGDSSSEGSTVSNGSGGGSGTGDTAFTDGSDGIASGSQVVADAAAPVTASGNAISVVGDSSSTGSSSFAGESGSGDAGFASTSGTDSVAGGSQVLTGAGVPVLVGGNAISVIGDSSSEGSTASNGSGSGSGTGDTAFTDGSDGIVGGSQVVADAAAPVTARGNALSVVGDSSTSGSDTSSPAGGGDPFAFTSGEDGLVGGTQIVAGADAPITLGGNAISVVGDSTVDGGTDGDDGDVGGETITPPDTTTPDGLALASVGAVTLLAATGSDLLVPGLALALLLLAAGVTFRIRSRTARS